MFGESRSESPRLPSPWQQAVANSQVILTPVQSSPISAAFARRPSSTSRTPGLRTPSALSLSGGHDNIQSEDKDEPGPSTPIHGNLSRSSSSISDYADTISGGSFTSDPSMRERLWSNGVSENLVLSPGKDGARAKLAAERDKAGHIEYKFKLVAPTVERFERLTTQLKWRLTEGGGEAMYEIGVLDDGTLVGITRPEMEHSLRTLELMAAELGATVMVLRTISLTSPPPIATTSTSHATRDFPPNSEAGPSQIKDQPSSTPKDQKIAKIQDYLSRDPEEMAKERTERIEAKARKRAKHFSKQATMVEKKLTSRMKKKLMGENNPELYDDVDSGQSGTESKTGGVAIARPLGCKGVDKELDQLTAESLSVDLDSETVQAASWQQRNLERAQLEWHRRDEAEPGVDLKEALRDGASRRNRDKKRRKGWRGLNKDEDTDSENDPSSESSPSSGFRLNGPAGPLSEEDDDEDLFALEGLEAEVPETSTASQPLTAHALSRLSDEEAGTAGVLRAYLGGNRPSMTSTEVDQTVTKKRWSRKSKKSKKVIHERTERRRLELSRGDGVTPDGEFLFADQEDTKDSIFQSVMVPDLVLEEEDEKSEFKGVVERLVGIAIPEPTSPIDSQHQAQPSTSTAQLTESTSPTITVKPSSPATASIFALHQAAEAELFPSPTDTITMPFDTLSLSFSKAQTVVGAGGVSSSEEEDEEGEPAAEITNAVNTLDDTNVRLCVEAIVVKKMEAEDHFGFLDFGALG